MKRSNLGVLTSSTLGLALVAFIAINRPPAAMNSRTTVVSPRTTALATTTVPLATATTVSLPTSTTVALTTATQPSVITATSGGWVPPDADSEANPTPGDRLFLLIGRCEQPGHGWEGIAWDHRGSYNGGLGILNANWTVAARNLGLPDPAYLATPAQQIAGARDHARRHGYGGWTCWRAYHRRWGY